MKAKSYLIILLSLTAACSNPVPEPSPPRPALVMTVSARTVSESMALVGEVVPRYESGEGFRIDGKIVQRMVEVGTSVKKGQILARLDPKDPELAVKASRADVRAAEANLSLAKAEVERYRKLAAKNFVSSSALDVKEAELKTALARLAQLKAQADVTGNQAGYSLLAADRNGVVTMIKAEPGQVVESGELIAKIAGTDEIEVLVNVPESHLAQVRLHDPARIRLWANPQKIYPGKVREIAPAGNSATRTFNVRVTVRAPDPEIKLGMTARVSFGADQASVIIIPSTALTQVNGKKTVWIVDANNTAQPREVIPGPFGENGIEIISGLSPGERIAVAGVHTLTPGQIVNPVASH